MPEGRTSPNSDEAFQKLLLRIAARAAERADAASLIQLFCAATREFFQVSGVYFWRRHAGDELIGEQADGKLAERFIGLRLLPQQSAVTSRNTIVPSRIRVVLVFMTTPSQSSIRSSNACFRHAARHFQPCLVQNGCP